MVTSEDISEIRIQLHNYSLRLDSLTKFDRTLPNLLSVLLTIVNLVDHVYGLASRKCRMFSNDLCEPPPCTHDDDAFCVHDLLVQDELEDKSWLSKNTQSKGKQIRKIPIFVAMHISVITDRFCTMSSSLTTHFNCCRIFWCRARLICFNMSSESMFICHIIYMTINSPGIFVSITALNLGWISCCSIRLSSSFIKHLVLGLRLNQAVSYNRSHFIFEKRSSITIFLINTIRELQSHHSKKLLRIFSSVSYLPRFSRLFMSILKVTPTVFHFVAKSVRLIWIFVLMLLKKMKHLVECIQSRTIHHSQILVIRKFFPKNSEKNSHSHDDRKLLMLCDHDIWAELNSQSFVFGYQLWPLNNQKSQKCKNIYFATRRGQKERVDENYH